jgi:argininosuccinate lyase
MLRHTRVNRQACRAAAADPALLATDLAEYLVAKGLPFRRAHHVVGTLVASAERLGKGLNQLTLAELQAAEKTFGPDALQVFNLPHAMTRRKLTGSPGVAQVQRQLARWKKLLRHPVASKGHAPPRGV